MVKKAQGGNLMDEFENLEQPQEELELPEEQPDAEPAEAQEEEPGAEHIHFEVTPVEQPRQETPAPQPKKERKHVGLWVVIALLVVALIGQAVGIAYVAGGSKGVASSAINENGELILTYTDGSTQNLGVVVGKDGSNGANGTTTVITTGDAHTVNVSNALRSSVSVFCTFVQEGRRGGSYPYYSAGSGVIYQLDKERGDAFIITNFHVVYDDDSRQENGIAETISVYLYGSEYSGLELEATYVGGSMYYDIAVLRVEGSEVLKQSDALAVSVADSDAVQVGSTAIAIGNAEGSGISVTSGVVSVDSEYITMTASDGVTEVDYRVMRVDTAVNSGNSGGGLFDSQGQLIGIVNAKTVEDGVENIGYALPSSVVVGVAENIIDYCYGTECESVMRAMMGITVTTTDSRAVYDAETGLVNIVETVAVYEVSQGQLGQVFQPEDVLLSITIGGQTTDITRQYQLIDRMLSARVGDTVTFTVLRGSEEVELNITVTEDCLTAY